MPNTQSAYDWIAELEKQMVFVEAEKKVFSFQDKVDIEFKHNYHISKFLVTQGLWKAVMETEDVPCRFKGDNRPMERVSWDDIVGNKEKDIKVFLYHLNNIPEVKEKDYTYRLPSETEWEYAARGGRHWKDGYTYAGSNRLKEVGWYTDNSHQETKVVGLKRPNQLGLYDMSGNVEEWCQDVWHENDEVANMQGKNGVAWMDGGEQGRRVVRGGSWYFNTVNSRVAYRNWYITDFRDYIVGFRLARY